MKITRKILSVILIISLLFVALQTSVLATGLEDIPELSNLFNDGNTTNETSSGTNNTNNITNANNTTNNTSANETLPKTGITEDYAIIAFAVICGVSAIYAYKKVKNYNIK